MLRFSLFALSQRRTFHDRRFGGLFAHAFLLPCASGAGDAARQLGRPVSTNTDIIHLVLAGRPRRVKGVLLILLISCDRLGAIVLYKIAVYQARRGATDRDVPATCSARAADSRRCRQCAASLPDSPLVGLFQSGYAELTAQMRAASRPPAKAGRRPTDVLPEEPRRGGPGAPAREHRRRLSKLERHVAFLPRPHPSPRYRTVRDRVGNHDGRSRRSATAGSTSLGVVAPPIAEALIATAPDCSQQSRRFISRQPPDEPVKAFAYGDGGRFPLEFLNISERNFT